MAWGGTGRAVRLRGSPSASDQVQVPGNVRDLSVVDFPKATTPLAPSHCRSCVPSAATRPTPRLVTIPLMTPHTDTAVTGNLPSSLNICSSISISPLVLCDMVILQRQA